MQSRPVNDDVQKLYKVVSMPANFLIDEDGKIIARNISPKALEQFLESHFIKR